MLEFNENGQIVVDADLAQTKEVLALKNLDSHKNKTDYTKWITYVYHLYKKDHALSNFGPQERKQRVIGMYFLGEDLSDIEKEKAFQEFKALYLDVQHTPTSRFIENLKKDMEELLEHIRNIPLTKEAIVDLDVPDGKYLTTKIKHPMTIDNSKEKFLALERAADLISLYDKFNERLRNEQREEKKKSGVRRIFDNKK